MGVVELSFPGRLLGIEARTRYVGGEDVTAGRSAVWLARLAWDQEVSGPNPLAPIH